MNATTIKPARKPRPADVARWVAQANAAAPSMYDVHTRRAWRKERDNAIDMLASWGLDVNGNPKASTALPPAPKGCGHTGDPDRTCSDCAWLP